MPEGKWPGARAGTVTALGPGSQALRLEGQRSPGHRPRCAGHTRLGGTRPRGTARPFAHRSRVTCWALTVRIRVGKPLNPQLPRGGCDQSLHSPGCRTWAQPPGTSWRAANRAGSGEAAMRRRRPQAGREASGRRPRGPSARRPAAGPLRVTPCCLRPVCSARPGSASGWHSGTQCASVRPAPGSVQGRPDRTAPSGREHSAEAPSSPRPAAPRPAPPHPASGRMHAPVTRSSTP